MFLIFSTVIFGLYERNVGQPKVTIEINGGECNKHKSYDIKLGGGSAHRTSGQIKIMDSYPSFTTYDHNSELSKIFRLHIDTLEKMNIKNKSELAIALITSLTGFIPGIPSTGKIATFIKKVLNQAVAIQGSTNAALDFFISLEESESGILVTNALSRIADAFYVSGNLNINMDVSMNVYNQIMDTDKLQYSINMFVNDKNNNYLSEEFPQLTTLNPFASISNEEIEKIFISYTNWVLGQGSDIQDNWENTSDLYTIKYYEKTKIPFGDLSIDKIIKFENTGVIAEFE